MGDGGENCDRQRGRAHLKQYASNTSSVSSGLEELSSIFATFSCEIVIVARGGEGGGKLNGTKFSSVFLGPTVERVEYDARAFRLLGSDEGRVVLTG